MMNKNTGTLANGESEGEESDITEMCAAINDLHCQDQDLEDNIFHIQQRQHGIIPTGE